MDKLTDAKKAFADAWLFYERFHGTHDWDGIAGECSVIEKAHDSRLIVDLLVVVINWLEAEG